MANVAPKYENHSFFDEKRGIIFGSLTKGTDWMEGVIEQYEKHNVTAGMFSCMGSLAQAVYVHGAVDASGNPSYSKEVSVEGPIEILGATGFLCRNEQKQTDMHLHGLFVDKTGRIFGGHIVPGKNPVLITIEFTILVSEDIRANRLFHPALGFPVISFTQEG